MTIPLVDVAWQHRQVREELDRAYDALLTDPTCDGAGFCHALEAEFAAFMGMGVHAVSVQSGRAGQFLALLALGIGPGDEVITVPNSDMATTAAISHTGARFVLVDVDQRTHNMDPALIESAITPRTRAIVPVHMYGLPAEMDAIYAIARRHDLYVLEDATLALGATYRGQSVGTLGHGGFFSFAPRKVLGSIGNGGMFVTKDAALARQVRRLKGYGLEPEQGEAPIAQRHLAAGTLHTLEGHNLKMDGIQAAVVSAKLRHVAEWGAMRQAIAERYTTQLASSPEVEPPFVPEYMQHAWRNYVITLPRRDAVREHLRQRGITSAVLYTPPVHLQPAYQARNLAPGAFPVAEALAESLLALPIYPGMTDAQVDVVSDAVIEAVRDAAGEAS